MSGPRDRIRVFAPATVANVASGFDVLGFALDKLVFKRLRREPIMSATMATIGLSILLTYGAQMVWGAYPLSIRSPFPPEPLASVPSQMA